MKGLRNFQLLSETKGRRKKQEKNKGKDLEKMTRKKKRKERHIELMLTLNDLRYLEPLKAEDCNACSR